MVLHCHHHFYFPRHSQRESFVDNILPNCIIDIWAGVSCTKNCSNKLKSRIHNLPSQKAAQFLLSSDPPAPWAYLFNWVTRSTTNKITPMAIALPTTTGMMYLEYHLHQQNRWVKGRQSLGNLFYRYSLLDFVPEASPGVSFGVSARWNGIMKRRSQQGGIIWLIFDFDSFRICSGYSPHS